MTQLAPSPCAPRGAGAPFWEARGLSFAWRDRPLFEGIDWQVRPGELWALIGPNGAGKTTLCQTMLGYLKPTAGEIDCQGRSVARWPRRDFARAVAYLPQRETHGFALSVVEVVALGRYARHEGLALGDSEEDRAAALEALRRVGLESFAEAPFPRLSGGERQLALLARCLAQEATGLILDEPAAALDPLHQKRLFDLLRELRAEGKAIVAVAHDLHLVARHADHVAILAGGRMRAAGPTDETLVPDLLREAYGVEFDETTAPSGERLLLPR
jgi:iron complex transport system ATP-binding protein